MTVEDRNIYATTVPSTRLDADIDQVNQILGGVDRSVIIQAINECIQEAPKGEDYDIADVVMRLSSNGNLHEQAIQSRPIVNVAQVETSGSPRACASNETKLSDAADSGILGGQISKEEREISRALEASLADSKIGSKRKRGDIWFVDPLNPHERKRQENWPVGLKNVGNTCWFSAVIQSLFHIPKFRRLILNFCPSRNISQNSESVLFVRELRKLFALMVASRRKYVDPSSVLEVLKEAFVSGSQVAGADGQQQDVSEFQHKLLDWLEDAFRCGDEPGGDVSAGGASGRTDFPANPMMDLFYGEVVSEGLHEGKAFSNRTSFGQFPLRVDGFSTLHDSLEGAMAQGEIESVNEQVTSQSGQEQWFERVPPLLTFELSRFHYDQALGRPEKIHNKLHFPEHVFLDRHITRQKREEVKRLRESLSALQTRLHKFTNYGSGDRQYPLADVLDLAMQFAQARECDGSLSSSATPTECTDVSMETETAPVNTEEQMDHSPVDHSSLRGPVREQGEGADIPAVTSAPPAVSDTPPMPNSVSSEELSVLRRCLTRWRDDVQQQVEDLKDKISKLNSMIELMYTDESLQRVKYRLHAVLVHEGQAASGHYWAYVYSMPHRTWLKVNDVNVQGSSWDELQRESAGGHHNASAYCLMYVDDNKGLWQQDRLVQDASCEFQDTLAKDLMEHVSEDNARYHVELAEWDANAKLRSTPAFRDSESAGNESLGKNKNSAEADDEQLESKYDNFSINLVTDHAKIASQDVEEMLLSELQKGPVTTQEMFRQVVKTEVDKIELECARFLKDPRILDRRLMNMMHYLTLCNVSRNIRMRVMTDQVYFGIGGTNERLNRMVILSAHERKQAREDAKEEEDIIYKDYHGQYKEFRIVVRVYIEGVIQYQQENYALALRHFSLAIEKNVVLTGQGSRPLAGADPELLFSSRRQCAMLLSEQAAALLEQCETEEWDSQLQTLQQSLIPVLSAMERSGDPKDAAQVEEVRGRWCSFLEQDLGSKLTSFQEFLSQLLETATSQRIRHPTLIPNDGDNDLLHKRYNLVKTAFVETGSLPSESISCLL